MARQIPVEKRRSVVLQVTVTPAIAEWVKAQAEEEGMTTSMFVYRQLLRESRHVA